MSKGFPVRPITLITVVATAIAVPSNLAGAEVHGLVPLFPAA